MTGRDTYTQTLDAAAAHARQHDDTDTPGPYDDYAEGPCGSGPSEPSAAVLADWQRIVALVRARREGQR